MMATSDAPPGFFDACEAPPGFADETATAPVDPETLKRRRDWQKFNRSRWGMRENFNAATKGATQLPPEYLRKIIRDHGDLSDPKFREQRRLYIGGLRFLPLAMLKLMENMPMPWEQAKYVNVTYHCAGALTIVKDTPMVVEPVFQAQWAAMWQALRREKRLRGAQFRRLEQIAFEGASLDFATNVMDQDPPPAVTLELDAEEDAAIAEWFYDPKNAPEGTLLRRGGTRYSLDLTQMATLLRFATPLVVAEENRYLWHLPNFFTAKAMHVALPGGPKFEPPSKGPLGGDENDDEWTEFNDLGKIIVRQPLPSELQVAMPWLYSPRVRGARLTRYRESHVSAATPVETRDGAAVFSMSPMFNVVRPVKGAIEEEIDLDDGFDVPADFEPFAAEVPLEPTPNSSLRHGLELLFAPAPFRCMQGKLKRAVDVPLLSPWYRQRPTPGLPVKVERSYQRLLKGYVKRELKAEKRHDAVDRDEDKSRAKARAARGNFRIVERLAEDKFFQNTSIEWLEAGTQLVHQGHTMLKLLLRMRNLDKDTVFDENFRLMATQLLSTKQRKRSRLGQSFHLIRELMRLVKMVVDAHTRYRIRQIDAYQLADALHYTFTHVAKLTGVHNYKYKSMQQVKQAQDLKHLIHAKFNTGEVRKGPGAGFWFPAWRMWLLYLRGMTPLLHRYVSNLLTRLFEGRKKKGEAKRLTKQRIDSSFDIQLKDALRRALINSLPDGVTVGDKVRRLEEHAGEAFRCWRANKPWASSGLPPQFVALINTYVKEKADNYVRQTYYNRERINKGDVVDKGLYMKNLGRITRLKLRDESERQMKYQRDGPEFRTEEQVAILKMVARWLESRNFQPMDFPKAGMKNEKELLNICLDRLRSQHNVANRLTQEQREEQKRIEDAYDAPQDALNKIRASLAKTRMFKPVKVEFMDGYTQLAPVYSIDPQEKMTDAFLDQYLWYKASEGRLFPTWVKPADSEPPPLLAYQFALAVNNAHHIWDTADGESTVLMQATIEEINEKIDWTLMRSLLKLIMHPVLVDYLHARHDVVLEYKDMKVEHRVGLIRGFQFASFVAQYWAFVCDLMLLGADRAAQLAGPPGHLNPIGKFADPTLAASHPIRAYMRYNDRIFVLLRYTRNESEDLTNRFFDADRDPANLSVAGYPNKKCWPRDGRMRLFRRDVNLGRAVHWDFRTRLPPAVGRIDWETSFVSVYSDVNPNLLFDLCGFDLRILPRVRTVGALPDGEHAWKLRDEETREITAYAFVQVSAEHVTRIANKIRRCILSIGNSPFQKIATKWNAVVMEIIPYYREAILGTEGLQQIFVRGETKIQTRVKMALNSKMPDRFPPVVFYTPPEFGGLGMISVGGSLIPAKDLQHSKLTDTGTRLFLAGMTHGDKDHMVPNVMKSYPSWQQEFVESGRAWAEYRARFRDAKVQNRRLTFDEVEDLLDLGVPRIRTIYSKDRRVQENDRGWRARQEFMQYQYGRFLSRWWYHEDHDGRLCAPLDNYKATMIEALGGAEVILEHTLFAGTGFISWDTLFWDKKGTFEDVKKHEKLTKAQRMGLSQIPNRRFALWWSPTINRSSVYAGYTKNIELMGVAMSGKLELIKVGYINLFAGHLWEKIHRNLIESVTVLFNTAEYMDMMGCLEVRLQQIPPKKSYSSTMSCPDIIMSAASRWPVVDPSQLQYEGDDFRTASRATQSFWIDIQLRWGDYDKHDINLHAKNCFAQNTTTRRGFFPHQYGIVIAFDLAYNCVAAFGYWIPELKGVMRKLLPKLLKNDGALQTLRTRMRRELQLYASDPTEAHLSSQNLAENLFGNLTTWLVDDSMVYAPSTQATAAGNRTAASKNGALLILNPKTGKLYFSVIHKSALQGHKRRTKLGREKSAEEVAAWLRSVNDDERPSKIVLTRSTLYTTMHSTLLDFQNIGLGKSDLALPLKYIVYHPRVLDIVTTATESSPKTMNAYDDWGMTLSPHSCFFRLLLILRGMHVDMDRARHILQPDRHVEVQPHHFWPTYTPQEWMDVEQQLHDIILADYARRNNIQVSQLTKKEIVDIILGKVITAAEIQKEEIAELESKVKTTQLAAQTVKTTNRRGEEITVRTTKSFEIGIVSTASDWRVRAVNAGLMQRRLDKVFAADLPPQREAQASLDSAYHLALPKRVLMRFLRCADARISIVAVLYGYAVADRVYEAVAFLMPPQQGTNDAVVMPAKLPVSALAARQKLEPIGIVRVQGGGVPEPTTSDLIAIAHLLAENDNVAAVPFFCVNLAIGNTDTQIGCVAVSDDGLAWAMERRSTARATARPADDDWSSQANVKVTDKHEGFFLMPTLGSWNYYFKGVTWTPDTKYDVKPEIPLEFYHPTHRPAHFMAFKSAVDGEAGDDGADDGGGYF